MNISSLTLYDGLIRALEQCKNDMIVAEQSNDKILYAKVLMRVHVLCSHVAGHCRSSLVVLNDSYSATEVAMLTQYEQSLNTFRGFQG